MKTTVTPWGRLNRDIRLETHLRDEPIPFDISLGRFRAAMTSIEVRQTISDALKSAHEHSRPSVLEIVTYRYRGHSVADPDQTYRSKEEIEEYKANKDPINLLKEKLLKDGTIREDQLKEIDIKAKGDADASAEFADASPYPDINELMDDIYWETDNTDKKTSEGTMFFETP